MPHGFEYVVRPFQAPGSLGNVIIPGTPERTQEQARITWGAVGTMPSTKIINPSTTVNTRKEKLTEQSREKSPQRIYGNDGESYIDVDRADKVILNGLTETSSGPATIFYTAGIELDDSIAPYLHNFSMIGTLPGYQTTWDMNNT